MNDELPPEVQFVPIVKRRPRAGHQMTSASSALGPARCRSRKFQSAKNLEQYCSTLWIDQCTPSGCRQSCSMDGMFSGLEITNELGVSVAKARCYSKADGPTATQLALSENAIEKGLGGEADIQRTYHGDSRSLRRTTSLALPLHSLQHRCCAPALLPSWVKQVDWRPAALSTLTPPKPTVQGRTASGDAIASTADAVGTTAKRRSGP